MNTVSYEQIELIDNLFCKMFLHDVPEVQNTLPHFHSAYEFTCFFQGIGGVEIDGITQVVTEGEMTFINSDVVHRPFAVQGPYKFITLLIPKEILLQFCPSFQVNTQFSITYGSSAYNHIFRNAAEIYRIVKQKNPDYILRVNALVLDILAVLVAECQVSGENSHHLQNIGGNRFIDYIAQHYKEDLTLGEAARYFGFSKTYFSKLFHKKTGTSFNDCLTTIRFGHAVFLLNTTDLDSESIAYQSGFKNARSFIELFKKYNGLTPEKYRKQACTENKETIMIC